MAAPERVKEFPWSSASATLPVQSLRDSAAAIPVGCPAWRRRFRTFSFRLREMMSGMTMGQERLPFVLRAVAGGEGLTHGSGQTRMPPQSDGTRGFWFCGGALLPFVLRAVAGACVGRWTGQPRMPPRERLHEGLGGDWGILSHAREWMAPRPAAGQARRGRFLFFLWRLLRCRRGILSHALPWSNLRFPPELPAPPPQKTDNYYGPLHRIDK